MSSYVCSTNQWYRGWLRNPAPVGRWQKYVEIPLRSNYLHCVSWLFNRYSTNWCFFCPATVCLIYFYIHYQLYSHSCTCTWLPLSKNGRCSQVWLFVVIIIIIIIILDPQTVSLPVKRPVIRYTQVQRTANSWWLARTASCWESIDWQSYHLC